MKLESLKMNLQSLKSRINNQKGWLVNEKSTKITAAFIQNKANFKNNKIGVSSFEKSIYEILPAGSGEKTNPNKPNSNPIPERPKINVNVYHTKVYGSKTKFRRQKTNPNKANSNPISEQFRKPEFSGHKKPYIRDVFGEIWKTFEKKYYGFCLTYVPGRDIFSFFRVSSINIHFFGGESMEQKIQLKESDIPRQWYNLAADLPTPLLPPLGPDGNPVSPDMLAPVFPMNLIEQEVSAERWINIPEDILNILYRWRPAPLKRAVYLEKYLDTPARIYYKDESYSPPGSHKPNTSVAQAWYNKQFGIKKLTTETGAGQWGSALAFACQLIGLECKVFMVRISFDQKPFRKIMMGVWGANCVASPSNETNAGRKVLEVMPDTPGSLGIAISEAIEEAVTDKSGTTRYSLGSVLNHVLLHQTIIGLEAKKQLEVAGEKKPDIVIGCAGGGSNFAGLSFPFVVDKINGADIKIVPVEPTACPTMTRAPFAYDFGDTACTTPLLAMHTLGHAFIPPPIHAGGLRYHGMAPLVCQAIVEGLLEPRAYHQLQSYEAAITWARSEGAIAAPETSQALAAVIDEAKKAKEEGKEKVILFNYSGHGLMDLSGYDAYLSGKLQDYELPEEELQKYTKDLENLPKAEKRKSGKW